MKELTNVDIYVAITKAIEIIETDRNYYMCNALELAFYDDFKSYESIKIHKFIPELINYKPSNKAKTGAWFPNDDEGKARRIDILTELQNLYNNK